jgi:hypothetical protein
MSKKPSARHRMKRPQPSGAKPGRWVDDIKQSYTTEQLAEVGAIALTWNQVEAMVDFLLLVTLDLPPGLWLAVAKRINGMDGKLAILRQKAEQSAILTDEARLCIKLALDAVGEYKGYRELIVHSLTFDIDKGIAQQIGRQAKAVQVLVTMTALTSFYVRLTLLKEELRQVDLLFRLADARGAAKIYPGVPDPSRLRRERDVPIVITQVHEHQNRRLSLPPLPEFPEEPEDLAGSEEPQELQD